MFCPNCGSPVDDNAGFCPNCGSVLEGAPQQAPKEKKSLFKKKSNAGFPSQQGDFYQPAPTGKKSKKGLIALAICVVAVVLVWGFISLFINKPQVKLFRGLQKTVFETKSLKFKVSYEGETTKGSVVWGKGIEDTEFSFEGDGMTLKLKDGTFSRKYDYYEEYNAEMDIIDILEEYEEELSDADVDISLKDALDGIINKKLDKKAIEKLIDDKLAPLIQESAEDWFEEDVNIPKCKDVEKELASYLLKGIKKDAIKFEREGLKEYKYTVDVDELLSELIKYLEKNKSLRKYFGDDTVDDMIEELEDALDYIEDEDIEVKGKFKISAMGYLTHFDATVYYDGESSGTLKIDFEINKK